MCLLFDQSDSGEVVPARERSSELRVEYALVLEGGSACRDERRSIRTAAEAVKLAEHWARIGRSRSTGQTGRVEMRVVGDWAPVMDGEGNLREVVQTRPHSWSCPHCGEDLGSPECDACREALETHA